MVRPEPAMRPHLPCFPDFGPWIAFFLGLAVVTSPRAHAAEPADLPPARIVVYPQLADPREHPDDDRRPVRPPDWSTFKQRTQFTTLRGFNVQDDRIVGYAEELEKFTRTHALGDVIWPSYPILFAKNLGDLADEIARRGLYLFDVWGYVPGSGPGGYWQQFRPPREAFTVLETKLGERWLGTDIGEQDGRYIGGYANQMTPASVDRFGQYLNFQRHFERMGDDLGHRHATLVSLNFGHYLLREGTYTLIGAETAQGLPNSQVYYAFIRGAGKQYGVLWFGNASIYNRWGYKTYDGKGTNDGYAFGPTKGSSLSLLKRLLYSHILYNCAAVGFENMWFQGDRLSPIGRIQQSAQRWVQEHGTPGVMHTPVGLLLDFNAGWSFPRHLYTDKTYRVWGNLPYDAGDYLTDGVLDLLYPGYANASYFHDESGFLTPTPYGDIADGLLSDAPAWLLRRYAVIVVAGTLRGGLELRDRLEDYVAEGGQLVITAGNLAVLPGGLAGCQARAVPTRPGTFVVIPPDGREPSAIRAIPGGIEMKHGRGALTVMNSAFGVGSASLKPEELRSHTDQPLPTPHPLESDLREVLAAKFRATTLFTADPRLGLITCRRGPNEYTVGVFNSGWDPLPLRVESRCGPITAWRELPLDASERTAEGLAPEGVELARLGMTGPQTIAGGDVRIFRVTVRETNVVELASERPPARPRGRLLPLRQAGSVKEAILARPTFFQHFDGVVVDSRWLSEREAGALRTEAPWLARQRVRIWIDLSSRIDLYPDLRLVNNLATDYEATLATITGLLDKMEIVGARDLILTLHRHPENNFTGEQTQGSFDATLRQLAGVAAAKRITLHLRLAFGKPPWNLGEGLALLDRLGVDNLKLAPATALLGTAAVDTAKLQSRVGVWLVAGAERDAAGQLWNAHAPLARATDLAGLSRWLREAGDAPLALDGVFADQDAEYADAQSLEALLRGP